ncbi:hypothetical protein ACIRD4_35380 [Streptomyces clavifer]|uniref:hypothetical protein n=1 Tax=Streptomyces clavifer TaxID=68188 RepID=UPI00381967F9
MSAGAALQTGRLLRAAGWPAPEGPDGSDDEELSGRASITERLQDEAWWVRQCAEWIDHLDSKPYPPAANLCDIPWVPIDMRLPPQGANQRFRRQLPVPWQVAHEGSSGFPRNPHEPFEPIAAVEDC